MCALDARVLRGEVEGHHLGAASGNFGLDDSRVLAVLVESFIVNKEVEFAAVAVGAVVLDGDMALLGGTHLFAASKFKFGGLEVDDGMVGEGYPIAVEGNLGVITVALDHGIPHIAGWE